MRVGGGLPKARTRGNISRERAEELDAEDGDVCIRMFVFKNWILAGRRAYDIWA